MKAVDRRLWESESLLEEVGNSAWFAFSRKRARLDPVLEAKLSSNTFSPWKPAMFSLWDPVRPSSSWKPDTSARIVSSRALWDAALCALAHLHPIFSQSGGWGGLWGLKVQANIGQPVKSSQILITCSLQSDCQLPLFCFFVSASKADSKKVRGGTTWFLKSTHQGEEEHLENVFKTNVEFVIMRSSWQPGHSESETVQTDPCCL